MLWDFILVHANIILNFLSEVFIVRFQFLLLIIVVFVGCRTTGSIIKKETILDNKNNRDCSTDLTAGISSYDSIITKMSCSEKKGLLTMVSIPDQVLSETTIKFLKDNNIGAVILFNHNIVNEKQLKNLNMDLRKKVNPGMFIAIDQEGGAVARIGWDENINITASVIGARNDVNYAYDIAYKRAKFLLNLGINVILGPVCDVATSHQSYIYYRTFGTNIEVVTKMVEVTVKAQRDAGIITVLKHFPGLGATSIDSHKDFPVINLTKDFLWKNDFKPFLKGIEAGAEMVMIGHIINANIDKDKPASMSINYVKLLEEVNFNGVVITDDLSMTGKIKSTIGWGINLVSGSFDEIKDKIVSISPMDSYCAKILEMQDSGKGAF